MKNIEQIIFIDDDEINNLIGERIVDILEAKSIKCEFCCDWLGVIILLAKVRLLKMDFVIE